MRTVPYGDDPDQVADLHLPPGPDPVPVVVLLHGGFWLDRYRRDLMVPQAGALVGAGLAVWNVEYRRVGGAGGWPETLADVAAAIDHLAELDEPRLDLRRVVLLGHSAGGQLALWAATRHRLRAGRPGAGPAVSACAVVGQAAVADLRRAAELGLGGGAVGRLLGGTPAQVPDRYRVADPAARLPVGVPVLLVHGREDALVPPAMSRRFARAARGAGDRVTVEIVPGDHFAHLDVDTRAWEVVRGWLDEVCAP